MLAPVLEVLPLSIRGLVESLPSRVYESLEEIRVRQESPLEVATPFQSMFLSPSGRMVTREREGYRPNREDCQKMLNLISRHSLYALEEELRRGYVTIRGGHRVGLSGRVVVETGKVKHIRDVTGFNLRVARQVKGAARRLLPDLPGGQLENMLIVYPPQCGKTTLLRDLTPIVSSGETIPSRKVGVVDERSEIAGCVEGVPQHDVGPRTDVLDGCPKAEGMMMLIRSMSPNSWWWTRSAARKTERQSSRQYTPVFLFSLLPTEVRWRKFAGDLVSLNWFGKVSLPAIFY